MTKRGGKRPGAGRPKGSLNKNRSDAVAFVEAVEAHLRENRKPLQTLEAIGAALLFSKDAVKIWEVLMAYRYGRPSQTLKHVGSIEHVHLDTEHLTDDQLAEAANLVESAFAGASDPG